MCSRGSPKASQAKVELVTIGGITAPVAGSVVAPAWMQRVGNWTAGLLPVAALSEGGLADIG
jgi:hypothetical protein